MFSYKYLCYLNGYYDSWHTLHTVIFIFFIVTLSCLISCVVNITLPTGEERGLIPFAIPTGEVKK